MNISELAYRLKPYVVDWINEILRNRATNVPPLYKGGWTWLSAPLTSTSWDGDSFSTTSKTKIDLSAVFGVPEGVTAVYVYVRMRDSGCFMNDCYLVMGPDNTAGTGLAVSCGGLSTEGFADGVWIRESRIIPCDSAGDIYYQIQASGTNTMDIYLAIWGYSKL